MWVLVDLVTHSLTGVFLTSFILFFYYMEPFEFIVSIGIVVLFSENYFIIAMLVIMYSIEKILSKYVNYNLLYRISLFTFFYLTLNKIDCSYFVNLFLVLFIHFVKYNGNGGFLGHKKIFK